MSLMTDGSGWAESVAILWSQLHNRWIRMGTQRLADKGANCKGGGCAGGDGRGDCAGGDGRGDNSGGFETRPYGAVRYHNNIMKRD